MGFTNFDLEVEAAFFSLAAAQLPAVALVAGEAVFFLFFLKHIPGMCCSVDDYYVLFRQISIDKNVLSSPFPEWSRNQANTKTKQQSLHTVQVKLKLGAFTIQSNALTPTSNSMANAGTFFALL